MAHSVASQFVDVDEFFRMEVKYPRLRWPLLIVTMAGLAFALQTYAILLQLEDNPFDQTTIATYIGAQFFTPFALWFVFGVILVLTVKLLGGSIRPGGIMIATAWGLIPTILTGLVWTASLYVALEDAPAPTLTIAGELWYEWPDMTDWINTAIINEPLAFGLQLLGLVFVFVGALAWVQVVRFGSNLDRTRIRVAALVPPTIYALWVLRGLFA